MTAKTKSLLLEILLFNTTWLFLVAFNQPYFWFLGLVFFSLQIYVKTIFKEFRSTSNIKIAQITAIGIAVDSLLSFFGVFVFDSLTPIPLWLMALWLNFAFTVCYSFQALSKHKLLSAIIGAVFAPISYFSGYKLGAVAFSYDLPTTLALLALIWFILMPSFLWITQHRRGAESLPVTPP